MSQPTDTPPEAAPMARSSPALEERPPILSTWPRLYAAVLLYLAGVILVLVWFTGAFE